MKKGWETTKLGDLCRIRTGKKDVNEGNPNGKFPFFTCAAQHTFSDSYSFDAEALLIAGNGDVGKVSYYEGKFEAYQRTYVLTDFKLASPRYLFHILYGKLRDSVSKQKLGNTMPYIKVGMLTDFELPVPPLSEQRRIVGLLDDAFASLATAQAHAAQNLQNARALFESHLNAVVTQRGKGWVEKTIEEVCIIGDGNHSSNYPRKEELVESGVPFIRATNMIDGRISGDDMRFLSPEKHAQLKKGHLKTGDILLTNRGEIGKTAIVDEDYDNANLNSQIAWLRCRQEMNNRFLFHVLNSPAIQAHFESAKNGAALQQFTIRQLKELNVLQPPISEQKSVVAHLDALSAETQRLMRIYEQKLVALAELKKSLLHQAFSGEL
jgi:type I restriction enzyme S subunit